MIKHNKSRNKGFTLIELLVVIAIIGVLASIVTSSLSSARAKARDARRESDIKSIQTALEMYYLDNGHYPALQAGLPRYWSHSYDSTAWSDLETEIGTTLPVDPINGTEIAQNGGYSYGYFGYNIPSYCNANAYLLIYNKETSNGTGSEDGVVMCNNVNFPYGNAFVTGMDKNGNLRFN